ncbi:MAG: UDP-N-acetylmuramate--L-alanine ligase [Prolixibacteraceae bacterium]|jgi:UDP-N-acetylmuramate--alanine ligase|nr:UDP-N-acetylmuramate--L-alanine ligase [Prolixibacteraceae bacterium]
MIDFKNISNVYFLGIGGIGMSALARYANAIGKTVAGYDLTETPLTKLLVLEGIAVHYTEELKQFSNQYLCENTLVVRTPAVPETNKEYQFVKENGYPIVKRSELLGFLTNNKMCIAVAGTHGKTSVSTMIAHLLHQSGADVGAFLGGISRNFNSNLLLPNSEKSMVVTEADEYDRSFLQLHPTIAVVTSVDADHLDIYGTHDKLKEAFGQFVCNVVPDGKVLFKKGVNLMHFMPCTVNAFYYSIDHEADFCVKNLEIKDEAYHFDFCTPYMIIPGVKMDYPGRINLENMVAAAAASMLVGADPMEIRNAMTNFKGVARRFDIQFKSDNFIYVDDYAHHPQELEVTIKSVRELYQSKKILGIFQPHLFSRTNDFSDGFAKSLDLLDEAILLDIYPARELPMPGVTSEIIFDKMKIEHKTLLKKEEVVNVLKNKKFDVLLTMGAGNIDTLVEPIITMLNHKTKEQ